MLDISIIDANIKPSGDISFINAVNSVVGNWLAWEMTQSNIKPVQPREADIILLVFAGQVDWRRYCQAALRRNGIEINPNKRKGNPYIITGGSVDASPMLTTVIADALVVGESYIFVRQLLDRVKDGESVQKIQEWIVAYPHAVTREQLLSYQRDKDYPYLLNKKPDHIVSPDSFVDWEGTPAVRDTGRYVRILASKGCHLKCKFCATTYRQTYRINDSADRLMAQSEYFKRQGDHVGLITNDAAALPYFEKIERGGGLDNQSITLKALRDDRVLSSLMKSKTKAVRVGLEGVSERIRQAFGKPMKHDEIVRVSKMITQAGTRLTWFTIVDSPYETDDDWLEFKELWKALSRTIERSFVEFKYTSFQPTAPAPLMYFVPDGSGSRLAYDFHDWTLHNFKSRHVTDTRPRKDKTRIIDLADALAVDRESAKRIFETPGTVDLAPDLGFAERFTTELVEWPLPVNKRWRLSRSYSKWMGIDNG